MSITRIYNPDGRVIGQVKNGTFCKSIVGSKHILRKPRAIAFSVSSLRDAKAAGAQRLKVTDRESGAIYTTDLTHFDHYSFELQRGGYELQRAMPLERFDVMHTVTNTPAPTYESVEAAEVAPSDIQLSLFAGM